MGTHTLLRTTKHDVIQAWVASRGGEPALLKTTQDALKVKIGNDEPQYEPIAWDKWFAVFDEKEFAFVYEDPGFTCKIVPRNGQEDGGAKAEAAS